MDDSRTKRQLEYLAVTMPASGACRNAGCGGKIKWRETFLPQCDRCKQRYWFREVADDKAAVTDAQTTAMLEDVVKSAKRGAAKGADGKPKEIAEAAGRMIRTHGKDGWWTMVNESIARTFAADLNEAHEAQVNTDAKTIAGLEAEIVTLGAEAGGRIDRAMERNNAIADLNAEVETLSETIRKQTRWNSEYEGIIADLNIVVTEKAKRITDLEATPAPPADSREAFEEWAKAAIAPRISRYPESGEYDTRHTRAAYRAWLAALEWRGSKPAEPPAHSREAFEEWAKAIGYSLGLDGESYYSSSTRAALHGWNSAFGWRGGKPRKIAEVAGTTRATS